MSMPSPDDAAREGNWKFDVGAKLNISECTQGSLGAEWPFSEPTKKS